MDGRASPEAFLQSPIPSPPLPAWEIALLTLALFRRQLWTLVLLTAVLHTVILLWNQRSSLSYEQTVDLLVWVQFLLASVAWPMIAGSTIKCAMARLGPWPPSLERARGWVLLFGLIYGALWILGGGFLGILVSLALPTMALTPGMVPAFTYAALVGVVYGAVTLIARTRFPRWPLLGGSVILTANLIGALAITYDPAPILERSYWAAGFLRTLCAPYVLSLINESWPAYAMPPTYLDLPRLALWRECLLAVALGWGVLWMVGRRVRE